MITSSRLTEATQHKPAAGMEGGRDGVKEGGRDGGRDRGREGVRAPGKRGSSTGPWLWDLALASVHWLHPQSSSNSMVVPDLTSRHINIRDVFFPCASHPRTCQPLTQCCMDSLQTLPKSEECINPQVSLS